MPKRKATPLDVLLAANEEARAAPGNRTALAFEVGGNLFAVDATAVEIVVGRCFVAPVPKGPVELVGVVSIHGRMRLAIEVAPSSGRTDGTSWWLVALHGDAQLALVADRIEGLCDIDFDERSVSGSVRCGGREARLLDPERLLEI